MFSGLTNQVSSWMTKKPEDQTSGTGDEKIASPITEEVDPNLDGEAKKDGRFVEISYFLMLRG